jgi:hypothetical protein
MFGASRSGLPFVRAAAAACLVAAVLAPRAAHAEEPTAPEVDSNPTTLPPPSARTNLLVAGASVTVAWYGVAIASSYGWSEASHASSLRIPFAGPFIALSHTGCGASENPCETSTIVMRSALSILSAVGQIGGVVAMFEGAFLDTAAPGATPSSPQRLRRASVAPASELHLSLEPTPPPPGVRDAGLSGLSVSVLGRF